MKMEIVIEDNAGNVIGFRGEETLTETVNGKPVNRGDRVQVSLLSKDQIFHRSLLRQARRDSLGIEAKDLPPFVGSAPAEELDTPENLKLFGPAPEPDLGQQILKAMEELSGGSAKTLRPA